MEKPRIFLGSSGKQAKLLQALTRGLEDVAHVEPWMTSFNPGTTTLERLLELTREVDFAGAKQLGRCDDRDTLRWGQTAAYFDYPLTLSPLPRTPQWKREAGTGLELLS